MVWWFVAALLSVQAGLAQTEPQKRAASNAMCAAKQRCHASERNMLNLMVCWVLDHLKTPLIAIN
jgi:hypothetical protein